METCYNSSDYYGELHPHFIGFLKAHYISHAGDPDAA